MTSPESLAVTRHLAPRRASRVVKALATAEPPSHSDPATFGMWPCFRTRLANQLAKASSATAMGENHMRAWRRAAGRYISVTAGALAPLGDTFTLISPTPRPMSRPSVLTAEPGRPAATSDPCIASAGSVGCAGSDRPLSIAHRGQY